jgi:hypothetical protein
MLLQRQCIITALRKCSDLQVKKHHRPRYVAQIYNYKIITDLCILLRFANVTSQTRGKPSHVNGMSRRRVGAGREEEDGTIAAVTRPCRRRGGASSNRMSRGRVGTAAAVTKEMRERGRVVTLASLRFYTRAEGARADATVPRQPSPALHQSSQGPERGPIWVYESG